jgi:hypothetical protein
MEAAISGADDALRCMPWMMWLNERASSLAGR